METYFTNQSKFNDLYNVEYSNCLRIDYEGIRFVDDRFKLEGDHQVCESLCPIECHSIEYSIQGLSRVINSSYAEVNIYYTDFRHTLITEIPKTTTDTLWASIGGLLGLFLGTSILSFVEILDLFFSILNEILTVKSKVDVSKPVIREIRRVKVIGDNDVVMGIISDGEPPVPVGSRLIKKKLLINDS